ncbi:hypothetical protein BCM40_04500 [Planococcus donghaensis]|uniref:Uncharacterized protein n=1 Tax=Planococcus donghaensis TaxID=414778 RepID=A0A1C7EFM9_9BACL|nr:hypothetical protein BCM40_04500 [Planococcus donghaensis]
MKSGSSRLASTGVRRTGEVAWFCHTARATYDPRSWLLELDNKKSGGAHVAPTGIRQSNEAALFAAQLGWLTTRGAGHRSLDNEKRKQPFSSEKREQKRGSCIIAASSFFIILLQPNHF